MTQQQPLLAYYGDDFTGSADVMEVLQWSGLRTVLFLDPPTATQLAMFPNLRAFGVAGWSRTMSPREMDQNLTSVFERFRLSGAGIVHYKTCSTFDSSPSIGSIGKALELGRDAFGNHVVPIVIGAPNLGRYQVFGNLFARSGLDSETFRLDRHPTMRKHPITPMEEADVRTHLAAQTGLKIGLFDVLKLNQPLPREASEFMQSASDEAILFDILYSEHLPKIGEAIQRLVDNSAPLFVVGSSGVEYALTEYWNQEGRLDSLRTHAAGHPQFPPTQQVVVITGSCSPVNDRQITWAEQHGFESIAMDTAQLIDEESAEREIASLVQRALDHIGSRANIILHSSRGPDDVRIVETTNAFQRLGFSEQEIRHQSGRILGPRLGRLLRDILNEGRFSRVGVAGGDTSGYIARELGLTALEAIAPVAPGSPLCRAHADNHLDGVEFFFKGGQVGKDDVWGTLLQGTQ